jgi:hypothetical protein
MVYCNRTTIQSIHTATTALSATSHTNHYPPTQTTTYPHSNYLHPTLISLSSPVVIYRNHPTLATASPPRPLSNQHTSKPHVIQRSINRTHTKQTIKQSKPIATTTPSCHPAAAQWQTAVQSTSPSPPTWPQQAHHSSHEHASAALQAREETKGLRRSVQSEHPCQRRESIWKI